jgi:hypothetical protein
LGGKNQEKNAISVYNNMDLQAKRAINVAQVNSGKYKKSLLIFRTKIDSSSVLIMIIK